jgi:hypothetical protein
MVHTGSEQVPGATFHLSGADSLPFVEDSSVDLMTAATSGKCSVHMGKMQVFTHSDDFNL